MLDNPNLLSNGAMIAVFDHELAFNSLRPGAQIPGWSYSVERRSDHPFYKGLRGRHFDLGAFRDRLESLDDEGLSGLCASVPATFAVQDMMSTICEWLRRIRTESDAFVRLVHGVLS